MSWFTRIPKKRLPSRFPRDMVALLEHFRRDESTPGGLLDPFERMKLIGSVLAPFVQDANSDPHGFFTDLQSVVAGDSGGLATFGAARLVWELLYPEVRNNPPRLL